MMLRSAGRGLLAVTTVAEAKRAQAEGRAANVGDRNPYFGRLALAVAWRNGYRQMIEERITASRSYRNYLAHRPNN